MSQKEMKIKPQHIDFNYIEPRMYFRKYHEVLLREPQERGFYKNIVVHYCLVRYGSSVVGQWIEYNINGNRQLRESSDVVSEVNDGEMAFNILVDLLNISQTTRIIINHKPRGV